ncbi:mobile mystery protein A [Flavobacterium sp. CF136]|uniref:mobile mystery protein A n=1 Tax=Flavobacterium sp. (strain CF136) TaxID=1144313 RepID=UPI00027196B7|nr:mobile mystery protein A [Flavobacterium sp. CF136]EJL62830.1 mobile mystery protein A [Flavobacterium sp. CF136]
MRNQKKLLIEQLDRKLKPYQGTEKVIIPSQGWVYTIRTTLNMTLEQLGNKLNMTKQGAKNIEKRESSEAISIKSLKEIGNALDMKFVYGFVPNHGTIENLINYKASELAKKIVLRTSNNMKLENQENSDEQIDRAIKELASEIKREMRKSLWE